MKAGLEFCGHDLSEHDDFGDAGGHGGHAEGHGGAYGHALGEEAFHDGHDAGDVGVEGNAHDDGGGHGPPLARAEVFGEPVGGHEAVQGSAERHAPR